MKEIIYLDTNLVNSLLAQQNAGLITKLVNEDGEATLKLKEVQSKQPYPVTLASLLY